MTSESQFGLNDVYSALGLFLEGGEEKKIPFMKNVICMQSNCKIFDEPQQGYHNGGALHVLCGCLKNFCRI